MEGLIEIINQLQDVFSAGGSQVVDLPQVIVIGSQSSGKSSVLEHLVGKSFLPRGTGTVTRCPLVLQMLHATGKSVQKEYAIFQHDQNKIFTDNELISQEIEEQTERLAGNNKGICRTPIILKIYSDSLLNLTLVDLPGLTKVPVGDQPEDIDKQTRELTVEYAENPDSIILAVTPANADMATSESLKIAREVDPDGTRTLAVITKLDLMDEGTDAWDMLSGKIIPVKLGIIGVVNRSQKDIIENKSFAQSLTDEAKFFQSKYKSLSSMHGTPYLKKTVQCLLVNHIKKCLPNLRSNINQKLLNYRQELEDIEESEMDTPSLLVYLLTKFSTAFCSAIRGNSATIETTKLSGGAKINYVFQQTLSSALGSINALAGLSKEAILTAMENASGTRPTLFVPEVAFELLVKKQIKQLRVPCQQCVNLIHEELNEIVQNCVDDADLDLQRYPQLQREILVVVTDILKSRIPLTLERVNYHIDIQLDHINTAHPDFQSNSLKSIKTATAKKDCKETASRGLPVLRLSEDEYACEEELETSHHQPQEKTSEKDKGKRDYHLIRNLVECYFSIVRKSVQDIVPKIVMHSLVNFVVNHLQSELLGRLYQKSANDLLQEANLVTVKRREIRAVISELEEAAAILNNLSFEIVSKEQPTPDSSKKKKTKTNKDKTNQNNEIIWPSIKK